ncbi:MAG TPA: hypothetical protein VJ965_09840, partial [Anaerolineales bacterium]|nr:hypothetical protein [Anaerolineales bacterium]
MRIRRNNSILRWMSVAILLLAIILLTIQLIIFSRSRITYPSRLEIGGVPVGGLTREQAGERLLQVFNQPVELSYQGALIHLDPAVIGFELNLESMLATADFTRIGGEFWNEFWAFVWNRERDIQSVPLDASYSEANLRSYLEDEVGSRYDQPAVAARPQVGSVAFQPGEAGTSINVDRAVLLIESALFSATSRRVNLPIQEREPGRTSFDNLEILLK